MDANSKLLTRGEILISRLYNLCPKGIGTTKVESLISYLCRLAEAHSVALGTLLKSEIFPNLNKEYLLKSMKDGGSRYYDAASALIGVGKMAQNLVSVLEHQTLRNDLHYLTLLPWQNFVTARELIRPIKSWCPECLANWRENNQEIYEPLIWNIKEVEVCNNHKRSLMTRCPSCHKQIPLLSRKSRCGYCSICGAWLGSLDNNSSVEPSNYQLELAENMEQFFSHQIESVQDLLERWSPITRIIDNNFAGSINRFAKELGFPKRSVRVWYNSEAQPSLKVLLRICVALSVPLYKLHEDKNLEVKVSGQNVVKINAITKRARRKLDLSMVEEYLEYVIADKQGPPLSLYKITGDIGYSRKVLHRYFPEKCKAIATKYREFLLKSKAQRIAKMQTEIRTTINNLLTNGIYPSRRKVEELVKRPGLLREEVLNHYWKELLDNHYKQPSARK